MKFEALPFLLAGPVHEEAIVDMDGQDSYDHVAKDPERRNPAEQADKQAQATKEFGADRQKSKRNWDMHLLREELHGSFESVAAEPSQHFLCAVGKKNRAQGEAHDGERKVIGGGKKLTQTVLLGCELLGNGEAAHGNGSVLKTRKYGLDPTVLRCGAEHDENGC